MKELVFSGSAESVGQQHGEALRAEINEVFSIYADLWKLSDEDLHNAVLPFQTLTFKYFGSIDSEISGISAGANMSDEQIYAINARTELLQGISIPECTAVGVLPHMSYWDNVVVAQNWDWINSLKGLARVVELNVDGNPRIKTLIEPGMVAKIGLNDVGVGLCVNFLECLHEKKEGVPVHIMYRAILDSLTIDGAVRTILRVPHASSTHYLLADFSGKFVSIEATPFEVSRKNLNDVFVHTNSYLHRGELCERQKKCIDYLKEKLIAKKRISFDDISRSLSVVGVLFPESKFIGSIETLATIILNLKQKQMLVKDHGEKEFVMHYFH